MSVAFDKFDSVRKELSAGLIERDEEVLMLMTALAAGEHALLVSPPGCAKSLLVDSLIGAIEEPTFSILLTKYTAPEEVMGPLSLNALKADRYRRVTTHRLPEATACFLDEIWKSSSAVLNTFLRILNEGVYENDGAWHKSPLRFAVGASNEWPNSENGGVELGALFDRFVFRKAMRSVRTQRGQDRLLFGTDVGPVVTARITCQDIDDARSESAAIPFSDEAKQALLDVLSVLAKDGVIPSDRRKRKAVGAARAAAWMAGATEVAPSHLEVLVDVLWDDPAEQPAKVAEAIAKTCNPVGLRVNSLLTEAESIFVNLDDADIGKLSVAVGKGREIMKRLKSVGTDARATAAYDYVKSGVDEMILRASGGRD